MMYAAFARSAFQTRVAYRGQVWASLFGKLVQVFARIAIWMSVYAGAGAVSGITLPEMVTYAVLGSTVLSAWSYQDLINGVGNALKTGDVAVYLLKPLSYPLYLFATECGNLAYWIVVVAVPTIVIIALIYGLLPPASIGHGLFFLAYWLMAFLILFLIAALFGLMAFWLMTAFSLEWLLQGIMSLLSGTFLPFWFYPEPFGAIARHLPFAWVGFYPSAVYLGTMPFEQCWIYLGYGLLWVVALASGVALLWRRAALRITVQGG